MHNKGFLRQIVRERKQQDIIKKCFFYLLRAKIKRAINDDLYIIFVAEDRLARRCETIMSHEVSVPLVHDVDKNHKIFLRSRDTAEDCKCRKFYLYLQGSLLESLKRRQITMAD